MGDNDKHCPHDRDRYRRQMERIFRDGPPMPPVSHDSIEVMINGEVVDPDVLSQPPTLQDLSEEFKEDHLAEVNELLHESHPLPGPLMAEPVVYPADELSVKITYECGSQAFDGIEMRCGMMVAPAPSEKGDGMIVYIAGAPRDILAMVLAAVDSADGFGLRDALKVCIERDVGMDEVSEVLGEEWWLG